MTQRKRARASTSQSMEEEPEWVGGFFDRLFIVESNLNKHFDQVDTRFDHFEKRMDHVEYDIHQRYAFNNLNCTRPPPSQDPQVPPSQGDDYDSAS